jgi:hypothetical protein
VDGLDFEKIKADFLASCQEARTWLPLVGASGTRLGAAVATVAGLKKPVFVSVGHGLSLELALEIVFATSRYRQPEPIRNADQRSREFIRLQYGKGQEKEEQKKKKKKKGKKKSGKSKTAKE